MGCKGSVKVVLSICDNHTRSFTGADVPSGACRVTSQACSSLCEQVQKMCSGKRAGFSQPTREGCSPSIVQFWEPTSGSNRLPLLITSDHSGVAGGCKCRIFRGVSFPCLAECCTVLRSRWYQSGINRGTPSMGSLPPPTTWTRRWANDGAHRRVQSFAGTVHGPIQVTAAVKHSRSRISIQHHNM
jgi:hypothetical protein